MKEPVRKRSEDYRQSDAYQEMRAKLAPDKIIIERREIIDTITISDTGKYPPLVAAFTLVGDYLRENLTTAPSPSKGMSLEFKYEAHTFRIAAEFTG